MFKSIGFGVSIYGIYRLISKFYPYMIPQYFVRQKFVGSRDQWVMISGCSDGLGRVYTQSFIQLNYSLLLHGRNLQKIKQMLCEFGFDELINISQNLYKSQNKQGLLLYVIIFDYSNLSEQIRQNEYQILFSQAMDQISEYGQLSYLINNAGITEVNKLTNYISFNQMISVNCIATLLNSKYALKQNQKVTIVNISSFIGGIFPSGYLSVYAASKAFSRILHESINQEEQCKILNLTPFYVQTNMTRNQNIKFDTVLPQQIVQNTFKLLITNKKIACGHWRHEVINLLYQFSPQIFWLPTRLKFLERVSTVQRRLKKR